MKTWKHWAFAGFFSVIAFIACDNGNNIPSPQPTIDEIDFGVGATFTTHNFNNVADLLAFWNDPELTTGNHVVNITDDINLGDTWLGRSMGTIDRSEVVISLRGKGAVELSITGRSGMWNNVLFAGGGEKVILRNIVLTGEHANVGINIMAIVQVENGSVFVMEAGSVLRVKGRSSRGVAVASNGSFIMNGGEIYGGNNQGVFLRFANARFEKNAGGVIYGNVNGDKSNPRAVEVLGPTVDGSTTRLAYREDTITVSEILSIIINNTGDGIASQTGVWSTP